MKEKYVQFFYANYPNIWKTDISIVRASLFDMKDNWLCFDKLGIPVFMASYVAVSDDVYKQIIENEKIFIEHENFLIRCLSNPGNNIYFLTACGQANPYALEAIRIVKKRHKPKNISWHRDNRGLRSPMKGEMLCLLH